MRLSRSILSLVVAAMALLSANVFAQATGSVPRLALKGHDPVAYFTEGKPVMGSPQFAFDWDEGRYYFANARHRDMFAGDPDRYAPRFGGYCTASMTRGAANEADPEVFSIVDGRLYLIGAGKGKEVALAARDRLKTDPAMIPAAQKNWEKLRGR